jgi:Pectate lyase superfamily protein
MASAICTVNGQTLATSGTTGLNVAASSTITIALANPAGLNGQSWSITCTQSDGYNPNSAPALINATQSINYTTLTATFTAPALSNGIGAAMQFTSIVNTGQYNQASATFAVFVLGTTGNRLVFDGEGQESDATYGVAKDINVGLSSLANVPSGVVFSAAHDLTGTPSSQTVVGIQGHTVVATAPTGFQQLTWNATGAAYQPKYNYGPVYNVLDYGLKNDGVTANDTAIVALNTIITNSTAGIGTVYFPPGTYIFADTVSAFPGYCQFIGDGGRGISSILSFTGVGIFWQANFGQKYDNLAFHASGSNTAASRNAPDQATIITNASSSGGLIEITTATSHYYTTGDQINIFGVNGLTGTNGLNVGANSDPATPWTVTVIDGTHFTLNGTTFAGTYSSNSVNISNITGTSTVTVTTATAHGLVSDQLVYINPSTIVGYTITGNSYYPGIYRVTVTGANTFTLYFLAVYGVYVPVTGSGSYSSGGTVFWGGVCCSNSHIPLVGLNMQGGDPGPGNIIVHNCSFGGFKAQISVDAAELIWIERCNFDYETSAGYGLAAFNDNRTHSCCGIRIGSFFNQEYGAQVANVVSVDQCQFLGMIIGIFHHDGITHNVVRCNYENQIAAIISGGCANITYDMFQNDGTSKDVIQMYSDVGYPLVQNLCVKNSFATSTLGMIGTPPNLNGEYATPEGVTFTGNFWDESQSPINLYDGNIYWLGPFDFTGNWMSGTAVTSSPIAGATNGQGQFLGTLVNRPGSTPSGALDIGLLSYSVPLIVASDSSFTFEYHGQPEGGAYGPKHDYAQVQNSYFAGDVGSRSGQRYVYFGSPNSATPTGTISGNFYPLLTQTAGVAGATSVKMNVTAMIYNEIGHQATWEIRQQIKCDNSNNLTLLGSPTLVFKEDLDGGFTDPVIVISSNQIACKITNYVGVVTIWNVRFEYDCVGY